MRTTAVHCVGPGRADSILARWRHVERRGGALDYGLGCSSCAMRDATRLVEPALEMRQGGRSRRSWGRVARFRQKTARRGGGSGGASLVGTDPLSRRGGGAAG